MFAMNLYLAISSRKNPYNYLMERVNMRIDCILFGVSSRSIHKGTAGNDSEEKIKQRRRRIPPENHVVDSMFSAS